MAPVVIAGVTIDPAIIGADDVKKVVSAGLDANHTVNRQFLDGDHWQGGDGWIGPRPIAGEEGEQKTMDEIARAFTSKNVILEVLQRHQSGVLGREPGWTLVPKRIMKPGELPTSGEQTAIDEANAILIEWWDKRNAHAALSTVIEHVLYSSRGVLRLFVPSSKLTPAAAAGTPATIAAATPTDAALSIFPEAPLPEQATVFIDPDTKQEIGFLAVTRDSKTYLEVTFLRDPGTPVAAGATAQSATGVPMTAIRTFGGADNIDATVDLPLGGRLMMREVDRRPLISEQVRQGQKALNLALSMVPRNVVTGGFLERILTNAQLPGEWKTDAATGTERFVPTEYPTGAGTTTFLSGIESEEETTGKQTITTPGVHFREPVPVTSSVDGKRSHYEDILDEVGQRHVLMNDQATASGYSREQARADFEETLKVTLTLLVPLGRWLLETVLALTEAFTNTPGKWTDTFRVEFRPYVNSGPLSSDEIRVNNESVTAGTLSLETAMQRMGIVDVDAELARINTQDDSQMTTLERRAQIVAELATNAVGMPLDVAGQVAGFDAAIVTLLKGAQVAVDASKAAAQATALTNKQNAPPAPNTGNLPVSGA